MTVATSAIAKSVFHLWSAALSMGRAAAEQALGAFRQPTQDAPNPNAFIASP